MNFLPESRQPGPTPWLVVALCATYILAGLIGHDPWKSDDAIGLAIAHGFYNGSDWLRPSLAGEAWPEAEPFYYWFAAASANLTRLLLPFHEGARFASALFGGIFLAFLAGASRRLYGSEAGWGAPLLAIGTLGLLIPLHEAHPAAAILATTAATYWGAALLTQRPVAGAVVMGGSLGAAFLAGGMTSVLPLLTLLAIPLFQKRWAAFAIAIVVGIAIGATWPVLLAWNDPIFLNAWWTTELAAVEPSVGLSLAHAKFLGWFAWPVLFVAPWALWRGRKRLRSPELMLPLLGTFAALLWFLAHEPRTITALPLVPPLILLAASGTVSLRRGAANAWDWFGMMTLTITAVLVWLGSIAVLTGWPPKIADNAVRLEPGFVAQFSLPAMVVALLVSVAWITTLTRLPRSPWRVVSRWAAGVTIIWVLLAALWMPWIDYGKTYRPVVASLRQSLPTEPGCIARLWLGAPQRAALDYFAGIRTRWGSKDCHWLIVQGGPQEPVPEGWKAAWEGHRPGDRSEWLRLYRRTAP